MKRPMIERIGDFVLGRGFYIVLVLCVAVIGISGYFLVNKTGQTLTGDSQAVTGEPTITLPDKNANGRADVVIPGEVLTMEPEEVETAPAKNTDGQTGEDSATTAAEEPEEAVSTPPSVLPTAFTWPVKGAVLSEHSIETLAYDVTMRDWRVHAGMDIAAAMGTSVLATADGVVQTVFAEEMMGVTVVVEHGGGMLSTYSNLSEETVVSAGDTVTTGMVIGTVGDSAMAESGLDSHLHFAMSIDDVSVNPMNYLPPKA